MKRFPLQTLVRLREHRTDNARLLVTQRQREAAACRDACTGIEGEIAALQADQRAQRQRLMEPPPAAAIAAWPALLAQREAHVDLLGEQVVAAQGRLADAREALRVAEAAVDEARKAFFRAKGRQDALETRRDVWRGEQVGLALQQEEAASDDLLQGRASGPTRV